MEAQAKLFGVVVFRAFRQKKGLNQALNLFVSISGLFCLCAFEGTNGQALLCT